MLKFSAILASSPTSGGFSWRSFARTSTRLSDSPPTSSRTTTPGPGKGCCGLHFQWEPPIGKLMRVTLGTAFLVAVDIRKGSPNLGRWFGMEVSAENKRQIWAPAGFARGFYVLSDYAEIQYKCTGIYNHRCEAGIRWDDPAIGIQWPLLPGAEVVISEKDSKAPSLSEWLKSPLSDNFPYQP